MVRNGDSKLTAIMEPGQISMELLLFRMVEKGLFLPADGGGGGGCCKTFASSSLHRDRRVDKSIFTLALN